MLLLFNVRPYGIAETKTSAQSKRGLGCAFLYYSYSAVLATQVGESSPVPRTVGRSLRRMTVAVKTPSVAAASSALRCALLFAGCTAPPSARVQALLGMASQGEADDLDACLE